MLSITVPMSPVPASRPRVTRQGITYYENPYRTFKDDLKKWFQENYKGTIIDDFMVVNIKCFAELPKKTSLEHPKPDVDNYAKAVLDAMNKTVISDDHKVLQLTVSKEWADRGCGRIEIEVEQIT